MERTLKRFNSLLNKLFIYLQNNFHQFDFFSHLPSPKPLTVIHCNTPVVDAASNSGFPPPPQTRKKSEEIESEAAKFDMVRGQSTRQQMYYLKCSSFC
jgi:hypothetical protein